MFCEEEVVTDSTRLLGDINMEDIQIIERKKLTLHQVSGCFFYGSTFIEYV